jgi:hypothetical protein
LTMTTLSDAASSGDHWGAIVALRNLLAERLLTASDRDVPALSKQLRDVMAELDSRPSQKANPVDDLTAKRVSRREAAHKTGT